MFGKPYGDGTFVFVVWLNRVGGLAGFLMCLAGLMAGR